MAAEAERLVEETRRQLASFFDAPDPDRVVFTSNATDALNLVIQGMASPGDHFVATELDHNSVLRPLHHLAEQGRITFDLARFDDRGFVDPDEIDRLIRPNTRAVIVSHASNVMGTIQPIAELGRRCSERMVPLVVDAAQTAGRIPVGLTACHASAIAFTGHKSLFGPPGIGGLVVHPDLVVRTTRFGGTGIDSRSLEHTQDYPYRLEAGTANLIGILGLSIGLDDILRRGVDAINRQEMALVERLRDGLSELRGVDLYAAESGQPCRHPRRQCPGNAGAGRRSNPRPRLRHRRSCRTPLCAVRSSPTRDDRMRCRSLQPRRVQHRGGDRSRDRRDVGHLALMLCRLMPVAHRTAPGPSGHAACRG